MHGKPELNEPAFRQMQQALVNAGHEPVVPHDILPNKHEGSCPDGYSYNNGHSSPCYLRADLRVLVDCDAVSLLHGWSFSVGAVFEEQVAQMIGLKIFYPRFKELGGMP